MLLNNLWIKQKSKNYLETNEEKKTYNFFKFDEISKCSFKREIPRYTGLPHEMRNIPSKQHNFTPKGTRKKY